MERRSQRRLSCLKMEDRGHYSAFATRLQLFQVLNRLACACGWGPTIASTPHFGEARGDPRAGHQVMAACYGLSLSRACSALEATSPLQRRLNDVFVVVWLNRSVVRHGCS